MVKVDILLDGKQESLAICRVVDIANLSYSIKREILLRRPIKNDLVPITLEEVHITCAGLDESDIRKLSYIIAIDNAERKFKVLKSRYTYWGGKCNLFIAVSDNNGRYECIQTTQYSDQPPSILR